MSTFSTPYTRATDSSPVFSPDGHFFLVVITRGVLEANELESSLLLFDSSEVKRYLESPQTGAVPAPRLLFRKRAIPQFVRINSYGSVINSLRWSSDSRSVYFLAEHHFGTQQLYKLDTKDTQAKLISTADQDVKSFDVVGKSVVYATRSKEPPSGREPTGEPINESATALTGLPLGSILFPDTANVPYELWSKRNGHFAMIHGVDKSSALYWPASITSFNIAVSPSGRQAVAAAPVPAIPAGWEEYESRRSELTLHPRPGKKSEVNGTNMLWPWQYVLVDLDHGTSEPLLKAPNGWAEGSFHKDQAAWSPSGRTILLSDSFLPLSGLTEHERVQRKRICAAAVIRLSNKERQCLVHASIADPDNVLVAARFGSSDDVVELDWKRQGELRRELYRERDKQWLLQSTEPVVKSSTVDSVWLRVEVRQDINSPPALWATDLIGGRSKKIFDPNPQMSQLELGEASVLSWKDSRGYEWKAGLLLPAGYTPGKRYPLVIQTHGFYNEHEFLVDGAYTTGFAARALAASGIVVVQMPGRPDRYTAPASQELPLILDGFTSLIARLDAEGIVDPNNVGIIGFSRTSLYVENALIQSPQQYRAATIIDGIDNSYLSYMVFGEGFPWYRKVEEDANGGKPFGPGLQAWIKNAPGFNLDRVSAPIRIEAIGEPSLLGEWEIYSSLRAQGKPVDLIYIPRGQHILQKPLERYASQQGNVDWFRFWLQNYEDPDPSKERQYARWRESRHLEADSSYPAVP